MKSQNNNNESLNGTHHSPFIGTHRSPLIFLGLRRLLHSTINLPRSLSLTLTLTLILTLTLTSGLLISCSDDSSNGNLDATVSGDASNEDNDQDGYPASEDCDDNDPDIYPGVSRDCQSECDNGNETCTAAGDWSPCSAISDCDCQTPGETRLVDCEKCGQASQTCGTELKWSFPGDCLNQKDCQPGAMETDDCEFTGQRHRLCDTECEWGDWDETECGECDPGVTEVTNDGCTEIWENQERECNSEGFWDVITPCTAECLFPARTNTDNFSDEVCIPGGPFIMGSDPGEGYEDEEPEHEVTLTPYFIDKYEVTVERYKECVQAGACTAPESNNYYFDDGYDLFPIMDISWEDAVDFCAWDGGRTLPTEAQWEKAARGPSPSEVPHPWGWEDPNCDLITNGDCPQDHGLPTSLNIVDTHPLGVSYYGIHHLADNVSEFVLDWYDEDYYSVSPTVDPPGPATGTQHLTRGLSLTYPYENASNSVTLRFPNVSGFRFKGIRCARRGY